MKKKFNLKEYKELNTLKYAENPRPLWRDLWDYAFKNREIEQEDWRA